MENKFGDNQPRKKIGIALGSGGFRGPAHVGVIKALAKNNIPIDFIAGSSIGAWVGAHYAIYQDPERLEADALRDQREKISCFLDLNWNNGLVSGKKLQVLLEKYFNHSTFADTKIPLRIVATDLVSGKPHLLDSGSIASAVRASISIPLTFTPVKIDGMQLVDGGISNPVPDNEAKAMGADIVIGVNLYNDYLYKGARLTLPTVVTRSIEIMLIRLAENTLDASDIVIQPHTADFFKTSRLQRYFRPSIIEKLIAEGEKSAEAAIPEIRRLMEG
jgi:NTE family protein